jgi:predicted dehydrogenase
MAKLRLGVAGLGFGAAVHVPAFRALADIEVVAIAGSTSARAQAMADRLDIPEACDGFADLMRRDIDIVSLALPPVLNGVALELALARRLDVLVEKPVAGDAATAERLAAGVDDHIAGVDFVFHELNTFQALHRLLTDQVFGEIREVTVDWHVQSYAHRNRIWSWKTDASRGGGVMTALGAHALYLAEWLFGPTTVVQSHLGNAATAAFTPAGERAAADTADIRLVLANGAPVHMSLGNARGGPLHRWSVRGTRATAVLENAGADYVGGFRLVQDGMEIAREHFGTGDSRLEAFRPLALRFADAVRARMPFAPGLADGARVQALMAAIEAMT